MAMLAGDDGGCAGRSGGEALSELIAEARVLVTPDTTKFRRLLDAEVSAATKTPVSVPVKPVLVGGAATTAGLSVQADIEKGAAAATASAARLEGQRAAFLAKRTTEETAASTKRIAEREAEVSALLAKERKLASEQQALEAKRVSDATAESAAVSRNARQKLTPCWRKSGNWLCSNRR